VLGEPRQADRPPPVPIGFRPVPEVEELDEAVNVEGFRLLPASGTAGWEVHPKALLGVAWDDNPLQAVGGSAGDVQQRLALGCELRGQGEGGWRLDLDAMLRAQRYARTVGRDHTGGNALARLRHDGDTMRSVLEGSWERSTEAVAELPEQVDRQRFTVAARLAGDSRNASWSAGAAYSTLDYQRASAYFDADDRDQRRIGVTGSWLATGAADSLLGVEANAGQVDRPAGSPANDYASATLVGRWRHAVGTRSAVDLRLGLDARQHDADSADLAANDDRTLLAPAASARLIWGWETRSWLILTASTGLVDGATLESNAARRDALELWGRLRLLDRLDLVSLGWYARREDSGALTGRPVEVVYDAYLRLGLDYRLRDGLGLRTWAAWQQRDSAAAGDYDRLLVALELVAAL
jgi:hypothetical protein